MCRLSDVLEFLAEPGNESIWMLLDIKIDDPPAEMIPKIAATIASVPRGKWEQRIVLGCWRVSPCSFILRAVPDQSRVSLLIQFCKTTMPYNRDRMEASY